ncbi:MAG: hypothetical protein R3200_09420 [Xanthomonadales bacterium]|nr:hypothetical protein [Xanthomonadales bacterium]
MGNEKQTQPDRVSSRSVDGAGKAPWGRWAAEFFVIVTSILLAFGIEAWWDERKERLEEQEILAGLEREYLDYRERLEFAIERHALMQAGMEALLEAMGAGTWTSETLTLDQAVTRTLWPPTTELGGGVRDALVQAGRLELISDFVLREKLALWPGIYAEVIDDEVFSRDMVFDQLLPHLTANGYDLSALVKGMSSSAPSTVSIGNNPAETTRLLTDRTFRALIQVRLGYWLHAREEYVAGLGAVNEILELISNQN